MSLSVPISTRSKATSSFFTFHFHHQLLSQLSDCAIFVERRVKHYFRPLRSMCPFVPRPLTHAAIIMRIRNLTLQRPMHVALLLGGCDDIANHGGAAMPFQARAAHHSLFDSPRLHLAYVQMAE
jgi:hypothetical protein